MDEFEAGLSAALADAMWLGFAWCYWRIARDLARSALVERRSWVRLLAGCVAAAVVLGAVVAGAAARGDDAVAVPRELFCEWTVLALILGGAGIASARSGRP